MTTTVCTSRNTPETEEAEKSLMGRKSTIRVKLDAGSYCDVSIRGANRDRLQKICPQEGFVQAIEEVSSSYKSNMDSVSSVSRFTERKDYLDMLQRRAKLLLEGLKQGPEIELRFISVKVAVTELKALGKDSSKNRIRSMIRRKKTRAKKVRRKWLVCGDDLGLPRSRPRSHAQELLESICFQDSEGNVGSVVNEALAALGNLQIAITQAIERQSNVAEVAKRANYEVLMVSELADIFRRFRLRVSRSKASRFASCVSIVREAAEQPARVDIRSFLRSLPDRIFQGMTAKHKDFWERILQAGYSYEKTKYRATKCKLCGQRFIRASSATGNQRVCSACKYLAHKTSTPET